MYGISLVCRSILNFIIRFICLHHVCLKTWLMSMCSYFLMSIVGRSLPTLVTSLPRQHICYVACGEDHSAALTKVRCSRTFFVNSKVSIVCLVGSRVYIWF